MNITVYYKTNKQRKKYPKQKRKGKIKNRNQIIGITENKKQQQQQT